jgi:hypothetical protein
MIGESTLRQAQGYNCHGEPACPVGRLVEPWIVPETAKEKIKKLKAMY